MFRRKSKQGGRDMIAILTSDYFLSMDSEAATKGDEKDTMIQTRYC